MMEPFVKNYLTVLSCSLFSQNVPPQMFDRLWVDLFSPKIVANKPFDNFFLRENSVSQKSSKCSGKVCFGRIRLQNVYVYTLNYDY